MVRVGPTIARTVSGERGEGGEEEEISRLNMEISAFALPPSVPLSSSTVLPRRNHPTVYNLRVMKDRTKLDYPAYGDAEERERDFGGHNSLSIRVKTRLIR